MQRTNALDVECAFYFFDRPSDAQTSNEFSLSADSLSQPRLASFFKGSDLIRYLHTIKLTTYKIQPPEMKLSSLALRNVFFWESFRKSSPCGWSTRVSISSLLATSKLTLGFQFALAEAKLWVQNTFNSSVWVQVPRLLLYLHWIFKLHRHLLERAIDTNKLQTMFLTLGANKRYIDAASEEEVAPSHEQYTGTPWN